MVSGGISAHIIMEEGLLKVAHRGIFTAYLSDLLCVRGAQYSTTNSYIHGEIYQFCSILGWKTQRDAPFALHRRLPSSTYEPTFVMTRDICIFPDSCDASILGEFHLLRTSARRN